MIREGLADAKCLALVADVLSEFRKIDPEMSVGHAAFLVEVARREPVTMKNLGESLSISQSSTSRTVAAFGKWHRLNKPGYNLVVAEEDPVERRRKIVRLAPQGRTWVRSLIERIRLRWNTAEGA